MQPMELERVKQIDQRITQMHESLNKLYSERAVILNPSDKKANDTRADMSARELYDQLAHDWHIRGLDLPGEGMMSAKLDKALKVRANLVRTEPAMKGSLNIIAVPPLASLKKIINFDRYVGLNNAWQDTKGSRVWAIVLTMDTQFAQKVENIRSFTDDKEYLYQGYDWRGLGIQELLSAELQGINVFAAEGWTLLLKDQTASTVPCVSKAGRNLTFDLDDAEALIGDNYLIPALKVA